MEAQRELHTSVMLQEVLSFFDKRELNVFFEGTVGLGGHAKALLERHSEIERYVACDLDTNALEGAKEVLGPWKDKVELIHGNFSHLDRYLSERGIMRVDGFFLILASRRSNWIGERGDLAS